jgi:hypothetical protein
MSRDANAFTACLQPPSSWALVFLAPLLAAGAAFAADDPLFESQEPLQLRLEAPFVLVSRGEEQEHPARLLYTEGGAQKSIDLTVKRRGKSRQEYCAMPPLLLDLPGKELGGTVFDNQNRLKLVTYCDIPERYEQYILLEYLAYRALNLLTDTSFRVRLAEVTYYDSEKMRELAVRRSILLENEKRFGKRVGVDELETKTIDRALYDPESLGLVYLFEYLIGNSDWSALAASGGGDVCCHNIVPYAHPSAKDKLLPVPYDFDSSGLVDAPYALPDERLPISDVRQRLYRGHCEPFEAIKPRLAQFDAKRQAITALFTTQPGLTERSIKQSVSYMDEFFAVLADPKKAERELTRPCQKK